MISPFRSMRQHSAAFRISGTARLVDVIHAEVRATRQAITDAGHPNAALGMPVLDAQARDHLIDLHQRTIIHTGLLYASIRGIRHLPRRAENSRSSICSVPHPERECALHCPTVLRTSCPESPDGAVNGAPAHP